MSDFISQFSQPKSAEVPTQPVAEQDKSLSALERQYILLTQKGLPIVAQPYHWLAEQLGLSVEATLTMTRELKARGIIRRIAAVPNHYKLGYNQNGMTVWNVADADATRLGKIIGELPFVSHCYLRPRHLPSWPYNLFAMVHGKTPEDINHHRQQIEDILADSLHERDMLKSTQILKKTGLRLQSKPSDLVIDNKDKKGSSHV